MTNVQTVMTNAWSIARKGAAKFGGSVKMYFAQALKMAWAVAKRANIVDSIFVAYHKNETLLFGTTHLDAQVFGIGRLQEPGRIGTNNATGEEMKVFKIQLLDDKCRFTIRTNGVAYTMGYDIDTKKVFCTFAQTYTH